MVAPIRLRRTGFALGLFCVIALLTLPLFSSSSAKIGPPATGLDASLINAEGYCTLYPVSAEERVAKSSLIVEGEVIAQHSFWNARHQNIYTSNLILVYKVFKGSLSPVQVEVITEGGTVGDMKQVTTPALELMPHDMGVFFCEPTGIADPQSNPDAQRYVAYGSVQGFIHYDLSRASAAEPFRTYSGIETEVYGSITHLTGTSPRQLAENTALKASRQKQSNNLVPEVAAVTFVPTIITAGTGQVLTISGSSFGPTQGGGFVEFSNSNDGGATFMRPLATDYVSWSNTQIQVKVPSTGTGGCAGTGVIRVTDSAGNSATSAAALTITYAETNLNAGGTAVQPDHVNANGSGGYTFFPEITEFAANAAAVAAFQRAMNTWTCATHINWTLGPSTAIDTAVQDNISVVRFDNGAELPVGVAGSATSYYSGCTASVWQVSEIDVVFDDGTSWQYGPAAPGAGQIDFESVALHELGHGHQLQHIIKPGGVMHYLITSGSSQRVLDANSDIAGGQFVANKGFVANACGNGPMISATGSGCSPTAANSSISGQITDLAGQPVSGVALTLNGTISARTITDGNGRYEFGEVEPGGFFTVTPTRANYLFSPSARSFSLLGNHQDAAFTAAATNMEVSNPLDTDIFFVRQQYVDILGREPDNAGLAYWTGELEKCGTDAACFNSRRVGISAAFFVEAEFQQTGSFIYGLYKGALGRRPSFGEYSSDRPLVVGGANLQAAKQAFAQSFVQRAEFLTKYQANTSAASFVDTLIHDVRQSSAVDLSALRADLISKYETGASLNQSRAIVLTEVTANPAFQAAEYNAAFVLTEYFGYLWRDPDQGGYDFWLDVLDRREPGNFRGMVCSFITSTEYQRRFSSVVTRSNAECGR